MHHWTIDPHHYHLGDVIWPYLQPRNQNNRYCYQNNGYKHMIYFHRVQLCCTTGPKATLKVEVHCVWCPLHLQVVPAAARSTAQSDCSTSPIILLWGCPKRTSWPIRCQIFLFNNLLGLSLPFALTNQVLNLRIHKCGFARMHARMHAQTA